MYRQKKLKNAHSNFICNCQKVDKIQMSRNRRTCKHIMVHPYNIIILSNKKKYYYYMEQHGVSKTLCLDIPVLFHVVAEFQKKQTDKCTDCMILLIQSSTIVRYMDCGEDGNGKEEHREISGVMETFYISIRV